MMRPSTHGLLAMLLLVSLTACDQAPGNNRPTPTPLPAATAAYERMRLSGANNGGTILELPGRILTIKLAAHPAGAWAALAATQRFTLADEPIAAYARVSDPASDIWGAATQLDSGQQRLGMRSGGAAIGISDDGTVIAASGGSAADDGGLWVRLSHDHGATWETPQRIATAVSAVLDLAVSPDGWVAILASGFQRTGVTAIGNTTVVIREPGGAWRQPQVLAVAAVFGSIVISGAAADARAVAILGDKQPNSVAIIARSLAGEQPWRLERHTLALGGDDADYFWNMRGTTFTRLGNATAGIVFAWTRRHHGQVFALRSLDGVSWGEIELARADDADSQITWAAPAYDPAADRLVLLYPCCADQHETQPAAHYAAWSNPDGAGWTQGTAPLILSDRAADMTTIAQSPGSRQVWIAWVEESQRIELRRWDLERILPAALYEGEEVKR